MSSSSVDHKARWPWLCSLFMLSQGQNHKAVQLGSYLELERIICFQVLSNPDIIPFLSGVHLRSLSFGSHFLLLETVLLISSHVSPSNYKPEATIKFFIFYLFQMPTLSATNWRKLSALIESHAVRLHPPRYFPYIKMGCAPQHGVIATESQQIRTQHDHSRTTGSLDLGITILRAPLEFLSSILT